MYNQCNNVLKASERVFRSDHQGLLTNSEAVFKDPLRKLLPSTQTLNLEVDLHPNVILSSELAIRIHRKGFIANSDTDPRDWFWNSPPSAAPPRGKRAIRRIRCGIRDQSQNQSI